MGNLISKMLAKHLTKGTFWITVLTTVLCHFGISQESLSGFDQFWQFVPFIVYVVVVNVREAIEHKGNILLAMEEAKAAISQKKLPFGDK